MSSSWEPVRSTPRISKVTFSPSTTSVARTAPTHWYLVDALPATAIGKIQKYVLRDRIDGGELSPRLTGPAADPLHVHDLAGR